MAGVTMRWRSLTGFPDALTSMALRPEPPMSMHMVTGLDFPEEALRAVDAVREVLVVISTHCTEREGLGNRD